MSFLHHTHRDMLVATLSGIKVALLVLPLSLSLSIHSFGLYYGHKGNWGLAIHWWYLFCSMAFRSDHKRSILQTFSNSFFTIAARALKFATSKKLLSRNASVAFFFSLTY